ncbi:MAG: ferrous iron transport protein B, partial [Deltaproteobacteria bacterium]|nr:ferrous iron transport protein B [Deltaproteobacteria bacterium]
ILGISVVLWAMMTYPRLPENALEVYEQQRAERTQSLLSLPEVREMIPDEKALAELNALYAPLSRGNEKDQAPPAPWEKASLHSLAETAYAVQEGARTVLGEGDNQVVVASAYLKYRQDMAGIDLSEREAGLKNTLAGRIGRALETLTRFIGFDYRINVALVGGFAAKEVVVSTLGTAYSLGERGTEARTSLSERLKQDPRWNPLRAFSLILFTMLYVPCFVTLISIMRESSWKWAAFSILFNLAAAYLVTLVVYQAGRALGLGG